MATALVIAKSDSMAYFICLNIIKSKKYLELKFWVCCSETCGNGWGKEWGWLSTVESDGGRSNTDLHEDVLKKNAGKELESRKNKTNIIKKLDGTVFEEK